MPLTTELKTKIAIFGSAFNPPSLGHKSVIDSLYHFDSIILLPSISHAWGKEMLDYKQRCQLVELFIKDINCKKLKLSTLEQNLYQPQKSVTTFEVLSELEKIYPEADLTFVIGPDNLINFHKFYKYNEILTQWTVMTCPEKRPIRSTKIRENLNNASPITQMTTPSVEQYLIENHLYQSNHPSSDSL